LHRFATGSGFEAISGLGDASIPKLVRAVQAALEAVPTIPLADAEGVATSLVRALESTVSRTRVVVSGEVRRRLSRVSRVGLLAVGANGPEATAGFCRLGAPVVSTNRRAVIRLDRGILADLETATEESSAVALLRATGSRRHVRQLEDRAEAVGLELGRDALFDHGRVVPLAGEAELYARLGLLEVPPEQRDGVEERGC